MPRRHWRRQELKSRVLRRSNSNFFPKNPRFATSLNYTGALNLAHRVQQRTLRATSIDSHYVAASHKYMRSNGLWLHEQLVEARCDMSVISASCDDKCKVKPHLHSSLVNFSFSLTHYHPSLHCDLVYQLRPLCTTGQYRRAVFTNPVGLEGQVKHCACWLPAYCRRP